MALLRPKPKSNGPITALDLAAAEANKVPLCDEANLQIFRVWYQFGGLKRPLTPVEAANMPAPLAQDFIYLLKRMRELADSEMALGEWVEKNIYRDSRNDEALYPPPHPWE